MIKYGGKSVIVEACHAEFACCYRGVCNAHLREHDASTMFTPARLQARICISVLHVYLESQVLITSTV